MVKINIPKTRKVLDSLMVLHNDVRAKIFAIVIDGEKLQKEYNIRKIHDELKKDKIEIAYKNCALHIKELEKAGLLQLKIQKYSRGQETIIKPTEKAHNIAKFLVGIKANFF